MTKILTDLFGTFGAIVFIVLVLAFAGWVNIWALNTLFPSLNIPFTFWTWLASTILFGSVTSRSKK